jgi:cytochrome c biogenesis protein CcdA
LFTFAFLMGLEHALEADHVAAVLSLARGTRDVRRRVTIASAWGAGHAATLVGFGALIAVFRISVPDGVARALEMLVAVTLIALGADVLRRLRRERIHLHVHQHDGRSPHLHAHSHAGDGMHERSRHDHEHGHVHRVLPQALAVGGVHGLAGSAAVVLVSLATVGSPAQIVAYVAVFAIGTILGMILLSLAITLPLRVLGPSLGVTSRVLDGAVGVTTIVLGCWILLHAGAGVALQG